MDNFDNELFVVPELVRFESSNKPNKLVPHIVLLKVRLSFSIVVILACLNTSSSAVITLKVRGSASYVKEYISLDNGFKCEDPVADIGALLDWIITTRVSANRSTVIDGNWGFYMVLTRTVHYSDRLKAVVYIIGISNFVTFLKNTKDTRGDLRRV